MGATSTIHARHLPGMIGLPMFTISAYGHGDTRATASTDGAQGFLTKPMDFPLREQTAAAILAQATGAGR